MPRGASAYVRISGPCGAGVTNNFNSPSSKRTTVESNIKVSIIYTCMACEDSPQCAFFFCTFSCSLLALLASFVH